MVFLNPITNETTVIYNRLIAIHWKQSRSTGTKSNGKKKKERRTN